MNGNPTVDIVMGSYNGAAFIHQQIESLISQSYSNWRLIVRDDGSEDNTIELVTALAAKDSRINIVHDDFGNLGVNRNFLYLLTKSNANYVMYCDQDDVWLPAKIEWMLDEMLVVEQKNANCPVLVHCDAVIADSSLSTLKSRFVRAKARKASLSAVVFTNCAQGASIMMNSRLRELVLRFPPILIYDWHTAVIAAALGKRSFVDEALILYRQHSGNVTSMYGAKVKQINRKISPSLQFGIDHFRDVEDTILLFDKELTPPIRKELEDAAYVIRGRNRLKRLFIAMKKRYAVSRRKDSINILLYICGLQNI